MKISTALLLITLSPAALACYVPPATSNRDHASLVAEASSIVVAQVYEAQDTSGCTLRIRQILKGEPLASIPVVCRLPGSGDWMTSFSAHSDDSFWEYRAGRLGFQGDCSVIAPAFEIGQTYLVFLGIQPDTKQFEQIEGDTDKWLNFVQKQLAEGGR